MATEAHETKDRKDLLGHCPAFCSTLPVAESLASPVFWFFELVDSMASGLTKTCIFLSAMFILGFFFFKFLYGRKPMNSKFGLCASCEVYRAKLASPLMGILLSCSMWN